MQSMDGIYRQYADIVYRYLYSLTRKEDLAEELTQETFFQAVRSIHRFDKSAKLSTWLCAIAKNVYRSWQRKNPPTQELPAEGQKQPQSAPSAESDVLGRLEQMELVKKLHRLPEPYKEVLYLRIYGALSFRDIGAVMGKSENWARITFYRGKERLRKDVQHDAEHSL